LRPTKNEFCSAGVPALATVFTFQELQTKTAAAGITGVPADRTPLKNLHTTTEGETIGDGSVVQTIGFLIPALAVTHSC
jgi:hypothetical protein